MVRGDDGQCVGSVCGYEGVELTIMEVGGSVVVTVAPAESVVVRTAPPAAPEGPVALPVVVGTVVVSALPAESVVVITAPPAAPPEPDGLPLGGRVVVMALPAELVVVRTTPTAPPPTPAVPSCVLMVLPMVEVVVKAWPWALVEVMVTTLPGPTPAPTPPRVVVRGWPAGVLLSANESSPNL